MTTVKYIAFILIFIVIASMTVCGQEKSNATESKKAMQNIKSVFDDYVKYQESTDSQGDKELMTKSLESLNKVTDQEELEILINVWMYYTPTDFPTRNLVFKVLKESRPESIKAVKSRMRDKNEWETDETAPYSELKDLLNLLKIDTP
ncbi:MAG: hypothetical protein NVV82_13110 [Sporocytophaga sp.]|nr:hypothetical protein [Sporocytophaga sp.]